MSGFEKYEEKLPSKDKVYNLTGKEITYKDYKHTLKLWNIFQMKPMKYYHDFYLKCEVVLLADVFEKFRNNSLKNYGLCPSHYLSTPALS